MRKTSAEQEKLKWADAVIFQFPVWWFGFPAILKGWIDRVFAYKFAYGYKNAGNTYRYGDGALAGKRVLLSVTAGGPEVDYGPRGINASLEQLLFPITHGTLFSPGLDVLPTFAAYGTAKIDEAGIEAAKRALEQRLVRLFIDAPIPFRPQNEGDYPDKHTLAPHIAVGVTGIPAHIATSVTGPLTTDSAPNGIDEPGTVNNSPHLPEEFQNLFASRTVEVRGLKLHVVTGGVGRPLLLLGGWPRTWYAWRFVMPELARHFHVITVDPRGVGLSNKPASGYDQSTLASDMIGLMSSLGHENFLM